MYEYVSVLFENAKFICICTITDNTSKCLRNKIGGLNHGAGSML